MGRKWKKREGPGINGRDYIARIATDISPNTYTKGQIDARMQGNSKQRLFGLSRGTARSKNHPMADQMRKKKHRKSCRETVWPSAVEGTSGKPLHHLRPRILKSAKAASHTPGPSHLLRLDEYNSPRLVSRQTSALRRDNKQRDRGSGVQSNKPAQLQAGDVPIVVSHSLLTAFSKVRIRPRRSSHGLQVPISRAAGKLCRVSFSVTYGTR